MVVVSVTASCSALARNRPRSFSWVPAVCCWSMPTTRRSAPSAAAARSASGSMDDSDSLVSLHVAVLADEVSGGGTGPAGA